jgi:Icc protein
MPITLPPISRRRFLAGSVAAALATAYGRVSLGLEPPKSDPNRLVLISDTHIDADLAKVNREVTMAENLRRVAAAVAGLAVRPAAVLHAGDVAHAKGLPGDYAACVELLRPIREAGMPVHLMLGNHDDRDNLWAAVPPGREPLVAQRHITVMHTPHADWYLLDTLDRPDVAPGVLGEKQLAWLAGALDANPDRPAMVMTHHNPKVGTPAKFFGLTDFQALYDVIDPRKQVKVLLFGHTHNYSVSEQPADRPHRINLPPTGYVFNKAWPSGWMDCTLTATGGTVKLVCLDEKHPQHGQVSELKWR